MIYVILYKKKKQSDTNIKLSTFTTHPILIDESYLIKTFCSLFRYLFKKEKYYRDYILLDSLFCSIICQHPTDS